MFRLLTTLSAVLMCAQTLSAQSPLIISEINYHPFPDIPGNMASEDAEDDYEYIELKNLGATPIGLGGHTLRHFEYDAATGIRGALRFSYTFASGATIAGDGYYVVTRDIGSFASRYNGSPYFYDGLVPATDYDGKLKNSDGVLVIQDAIGTEIVEVIFEDSGAWPTRADGDGSSVELEDTSLVPLTSNAVKNAYLSSGRNWSSTSEFHGSPGRAGLGADNRVEVNEVLAHTDLPLTDAVELFNGSGVAQDVSGWFLSDSPKDYKAFLIPSGTVMQAGAFLTYFQNTSSSGLPFGLNSAAGDEVYLLQSDASGNLIRFVDRVTVPATVNGESYGRLPDGDGDFVPLVERTLGVSNLSNNNRVRVGCVVISEIHYNTAAAPDDNLEFVEITNIGTDTVSLHDSSITPAPAWEMRGEVDYNFANNEELDPGESLVVVGFDPSNSSLRSAFESEYGVSGITLVGPWFDGDPGISGKLDNSGGNLRLERPDTLEPASGLDPAFYPEVEEDLSAYNDGPAWPANADGGGESLSRSNPSFDGTKAVSWAGSAPTPGTYNGVADFGLATVCLTVTGSSVTVDFSGLPCVGDVMFYESPDLVNWTSIGSAAVSQTGQTPHRASVTRGLGSVRKFIRAGK